MSPKLLQYLGIFFVITVSQASKPSNVSSNVSEDGRSSLVFVFDTTGSMYNDLKQLREGAEMILKTALEEGNVVGDFVFVPFHDPAVGPATVTNDKEVFQNALGKVHVYGGGDCPEKSLSGIELALDVSQARSYVYVFTDATAGDHRLVGKVLDAVQRKQSQVVFVLTGHCNDVDKPSYKVYQQIAAASSGQVFNLNKTSVHKVLDFVKSSLEGRMVNLGSSIKAAGSNYTQEIPVDSTLGEVTVSVSGAKPQISVMDPSGELLTGPPKLITTLDLAEIMVVKVMQPEPGNWTITVGSSEEYSVKVSGQSNLTFGHGFSVEKPAGYAETSYRPLNGTYNHMMVKLSQKDPPVAIEFAEILSMTGSTLFELPLTEVDSVNKVYLAEPFIPPDEEFFYVAINGKDENHQPLRRIGATAVQAKVPDVPYLTTSRQISAHAHSKVVLHCKVDSLVPLTAMWTRDSHKLQPQVSSIQTTAIDYVIEDMKEEDVGTYKCFAKNVAGVSKGVTKVSIIVEPPQVSIEPANKTLEIGDNLTITCTVLSEALITEFQLISNRSDEKIQINLDPNIDGIYTFNKTIQNASEIDAGTYTCIAASIGGSTNQSTTISIKSKPTAQILGSHAISINMHSIVIIMCRVDNCDTVRWMHNGVVVKEATVEDNIAGLEVNVTDNGVWKCLAVRGSLEALDEVQITVLIKPSVSIKGDKTVTILNGTVQELECEVTAKPPPRVTWHRETEELLNHSLSQPKANTYLSTLILNSSKENVEGMYFCYGENSEGVSQDHVEVNVRRKITVLKGPKDTSEELYHPAELFCITDSYPVAKTTWLYNGSVLHSTENIRISDDNSTLSVKRLDFEDLGMYSCETDDGFERVKLNGTLSVRGLESPVIVKEPAKIIAIKGDSTLIPCRIHQGNPKPTFVWEFSTTENNFTVLQTTEANLQVVATLQNQGLYRCSAENVVGKDTFDVELIVQYPPQLKSVNGSGRLNTLEVEADEKALLSCDATGVPPPLVFWTKDDLPMKFSQNVHLVKGSLVIETATKDDSGSYLCNASSSLGSVQKEFTVSVYKAPQITSKDTEMDTLEGLIVDLPCKAEGLPKPLVSWEHDGAEINNDRKIVDEYGMRFIANLTDFGNYTCRAINAHGHASVTYSLYVWLPPSIEGSRESTIDVLVGDDVSLQCDAVGFPIPTMKWSFKVDLLTENTTEVSFNDVGNLYIKNVSSKYEGVYVCMAQNFYGIDNKLFRVNVNESPQILDDNYTGPYLATNLDSAFTIACKATGKPKPYVYWSKDNVYLHKDTQYIVGQDGTLTIKSPSDDMSGNYTCTAKNQFGVVNKIVAVQVYSLPTHEQAEQSLSKATVLEHSNANVECPLRAAKGDTVQWYKDAELVSTGNLTLTHISRDHQNTYACLVTNAVGSAYSTVSINVEWPPYFIDSEVNDTEDLRTIENDINIKPIDALKSKEHKNEANDEGNRNKKRDQKEVSDPKNAITDKNQANNYDDKRNTSSNASKHGIKTDTTKVDLQRKYIKNVNNDKKDENELAVTKIQEINVYSDKNDTRLKIIDENQFGQSKIITIEVVKGDDAYLDCQTDAKPQARTKWLRNSKSMFKDDPYLKLMNIQQRDAGTYKCVASNQHGSVHRQFKLNVSVPPFISNFDLLDVTLMEGADATLECDAHGHPEPSVNWTYNTKNWNLHNSSLVATNITVQSEGVFRCDAKNKAGSTHITYQVSVVSPAKVEGIVAFVNGEGITVAKSFEAAIGAHLRLACKATGKPTPSIQWLRNGKVFGQNAEGIDYADLTLDVEKSHVGTYSCVVVNVGGSDCRTMRLEVLEPPKIIQSIFQTNTTLEVLSGQSYYLHCHPLGNPVPEVYWFKDGLPLKLFDDTMVFEEYGEVIAARSASEEQMGNYTCVAMNKVGNASVSYLVDVLVPPPKPKESSRPVHVRIGKPLTVTCPVEGAPFPYVAWIKHPYTEIGDTTPRITLTDSNITMSINRTQVSDSGNYSCIMTNKAGTTEVVFAVTVEKPPSIAGDVAVEEHTVPLWRSVVLKCEAAGHPLPTINWLKDTQKLSDNLSNVHRVLGNSLLALWRVTSRDAGQYICVVENEAGTAHRRYNVAVSVPGKWSEWSQWSLCNATCGLGSQLRSRSCRYIDEDNNVIDKTSKPGKIVVDESACKGSSHEHRKCQMPPCEEASGWSRWSRWAACSATCGAGTRARTRTCAGNLCEGDNVQITKCLNLPKCNSNEDNSENDVYSKEGSKEYPFIPEAVFEIQPEILNSMLTPDVEELYTAESPASKVFYDVNVTYNLDGSDMGPCRPGFRPGEADNLCEDIDECEIENNHCHSTQVCENTEGAYRCTCSPGYVSLGAGQRCMDKNECSLHTSGCEFACVNTAGGYVCACPAHMRLHRDKHHCYTVSSSHRRSYEDVDNSEYLSASVEYPARYKHIKQDQ